MSGHLGLPTSVQERLSGWTRIQEALRAGAPGRPRVRPTVTLSRQFGCEGIPLALRLQEGFQQATGESWSLLDRELLEAVAREEHVPIQLLEHLEAPSRYLEAYGFHPRGAVTGDQAFAKLAVSLLHFARTGNAIIIGRGGAILCRALDNCFHFRLEAGRDWRIASLARRLGISPAEAADREKGESRARDRFVRDHLGVDLADPGHYDAVFNNERHGVESIAAAILAYVRCAMPAG